MNLILFGMHCTVFMIILLISCSIVFNYLKLTRLYMRTFFLDILSSGIRIINATLVLVSLWYLLNDTFVFQFKKAATPVWESSKPWSFYHVVMVNTLGKSLVGEKRYWLICLRNNILRYLICLYEGDKLSGVDHFFFVLYPT